MSSSSPAQFCGTSEETAVNRVPFRSGRSVDAICANRRTILKTAMNRSTDESGSFRWLFVRQFDGLLHQTAAFD
jgi:hypothetical protein